MPEIHSVLPPSSSSRWLACPPSLLLNDRIKDEGSSYAQEGTMAHYFAEMKVRAAVGEDVKVPKCDDPEMDDCTDMYRDFVTEQLETVRVSCRDPVIYVEQRVSADKWAEGCFGTADCVIISDNELHIIDLKYGQIEVPAQENTQLKIYGLAAAETFSTLYNFDTVKMTIFQPRRNFCDTYTASVKELYDWAENVLKPVAALAMKGEGEFCAGEHCRFCKVKNTCRKRAEYNLSLARYDFEMPAELQDTEIEAILEKADDFISWVNDIKEYALQQALKGKQWESWKLVEGRSTRKYTDETAVANAVKTAGYDPYEHKVLGITAMTKLLGKKKLEEILGAFIDKPPGKPTLVPQSDRRPAWNTAKNDFTEE